MIEKYKKLETTAKTSHGVREQAAPAFDTLAAQRRMKDGGVDPKLSEVFIETIVEALGTPHPSLPTKKDLQKELKAFATKADYTFVTKEDAKAFATKADLKEGLKSCATKADLNAFATKEDLKEGLKACATKEDLQREGLKSLRHQRGLKKV